MFNKKETASFWAGFKKGLKSKAKKSKFVKKSVSKKNNPSNLLSQIKSYRDRGLGVLVSNGKFYDTNFVDRAVEIKKSEISKLRSEYATSSKTSDLAVANNYVNHMRNKYGEFDKNGKFLHLLGEK